MRLRVMIFCLVLLRCFQLHAQNDTLRLAFSAQGVVVDAESGRAIESALVKVPGTNNSTVTNADGRFVIKSGSPFSAVEVSLLGYETSNSEVSGDKPVRIRLWPHSYLLEEATIVSGDPLEIVLAAINKIPENYSPAPELLECFYRETLKKRTRYTYISEAVARMYKTSYREGISGDRTALEKSRVLLSQRRSDTLSVKVQGGPAQAALLDIVKNPDLLFGPETLVQYTFEMGMPTYIDGRLQFVINFKPVPGPSESALYYGTLYIDREKLYFTRIEISLDVSDRGKAVRKIVVRKPLSLRLVPKEMSIVANYSHDGNYARLSYFRSTFRFNCDWKKRLFSTSYVAINELVVTDIRPDAIPIKRSEMFRTGDILSDKAAEFTDPDFWVDYNIIEPSQSLEHAVNRLRKGR